MTSLFQHSSYTSSPLSFIKQHGVVWVDSMLSQGITSTQPGSISHLLYGSKPSEQSINIKFGKLGEVIAKLLIKASPHLELLTCGVQIINEKGKKKDIDLIWANHTNQTIYVRELKGNIELDTEKLPATFNKITQEIAPFAQTLYPHYTINVGILNWSVYNRTQLTKGLSHIKTCEKNGVQVDHMGDFLNLIDFQWDQSDFEDYFRILGQKIQNAL